MGIQAKALNWNEQKSVNASVADAINSRTDYLIIAASTSSSFDLTRFPVPSQMSLTVFRDRVGTERWSHFSANLPSSVYFLAVPPPCHSAVAVPLELIKSRGSVVTESQSLAEMIARLSASADTVFMDDVELEVDSAFKYPPLTQPHVDAHNLWLHELIRHVSDAQHDSHSTALTALRAGLYLVNDFFDESHSASQSIEGLGSHHTGDYWHAILHRREPDYGNSKYWFRHVGRHPIYPQLKELVERCLSNVHGALAGKLQSWKSRLIAHNSWDPFAFVDLCAAAEKDADLRSWCEQIQYDEMLLLLESTAQDAFEESPANDSSQD